jgi:sigma-E factor negative regulatory protein RseC
MPLVNEEGIVVRSVSSTSKLVWVKTTRSGSCKHCSARTSCNTGHNEKEMEVQVINEAGAKVGDRVMLTLETASLMKATFLCYIIPMFGLILGAICGNQMAPRYGYDPSLFSALVAFVFLALSFLIVRYGGARMSKNSAYRPRITRVLRSDAQARALVQHRDVQRGSPTKT